jgi:hypothetical protein
MEKLTTTKFYINVFLETIEFLTNKTNQKIYLIGKIKFLITKWSEE